MKAVRFQEPKGFEGIDALEYEDAPDPQPAIGDVKLEKRMTGRQSHLRQLADIPCTHDVAPALGAAPNTRDDLVDLIDRTAIRGPPVAPLRAVDTSEISVGVGPFVPDLHAMIAQIAHIRIAAQKPEQFVNDRP